MRYCNVIITLLFVYFSSNFIYAEMRSITPVMIDNQQYHEVEQQLLELCEKELEHKDTEALENIAVFVGYGAIVSAVLVFMIYKCYFWGHQQEDTTNEAELSEVV